MVAESARVGVIYIMYIFYVEICIQTPFDEHINLNIVNIYIYKTIMDRIIIKILIFDTDIFEFT